MNIGDAGRESFVSNQEAVRTEVFIWQIVVLLVAAGCAIACLLGICIAIAKLAKGISSIGAELKKMNAKMERVEAVDKDEPKPTELSGPNPSLEDIEAAISNFEKVKRVDLTKP